MARLFISHSSKDKEFVRRLVDDLQQLGHTVWLDVYAIKVGDCIVTEIDAGVRNAQYVVLVLSPNSVESGWVEREWKAKFWDEVNSGRTLVLPALVADCQIPGLLKTKKYADFSKNYAIGLAQLISSIEKRVAEEAEVRKTAPDQSGDQPVNQYWAGRNVEQIIDASRASAATTGATENLQGDGKAGIAPADRPAVFLEYEIEQDTPSKLDAPLVVRNTGTATAFNVQVQPIRNGKYVANFEEVARLLPSRESQLESVRPVRARLDAEGGVGPLFSRSIWALVSDAESWTDINEVERLIPARISYIDPQGNIFTTDQEIVWHHFRKTATVRNIRMKVDPAGQPGIGRDVQTESHRIKQLENQIADLTSKRRLTPDQHRAFEQLLRKYKDRAVRIFFTDSESRAFADDLFHIVEAVQPVQRVLMDYGQISSQHPVGLIVCGGTREFTQELLDEFMNAGVPVRGALFSNSGTAISIIVGQKEIPLTSGVNADSKPLLEVPAQSTDPRPPREEPPSGFEQAVFRFWPQRRWAQVALILAIGLVAISFAVWSSLPETAKERIIGGGQPPQSIEGAQPPSYASTGNSSGSKMTDAEPDATRKTDKTATPQAPVSQEPKKSNDNRVEPSIRQQMTGSQGGVQIGTVSGLTLNANGTDSAARIRSEITNLLRFPDAVLDNAKARTTTEKLLANDLPGRLFDLLMTYDEKDISAVPEIGGALSGFRTDYYRFRGAASDLENLSVSRIGQIVKVRFRQGWNIYYRYAAMRFGGLSRDQIIAGGDFLNYDITWDDAERVFGELAKDSSVSAKFLEFFAFNKDLIGKVDKLAATLSR